MTEREFTKILDWPGYRVYRYEIDERTRTLKLWVRDLNGFACQRLARVLARLRRTWGNWENAGAIQSATKDSTATPGNEPALR